MTTNKKKETTNRAAAAIDPTGKLRLANREKQFQQKIEKMQLALVQRDIRYKKQVARGLRELANARKMEELLADKKIKPLSDYSHLKEIYEEDLRPITAEDLKKEAENKTALFLTSANKVTPLQEKVVRELYKLEAETNQLAIEQVRDFLIIKGEIKETPSDKKRLHEKEEMIQETVEDAA